MCVFSGIRCVYLVRSVRKISWCVTGAIKVALVIVHEQPNDSRLMLISLSLAPSSGAGLFSCRTGLRANRQTATAHRAAECSSITPTARGREAGPRRREGRTEERQEGWDQLVVMTMEVLICYEKQKHSIHVQVSMLFICTATYLSIEKY